MTFSIPCDVCRAPLSGDVVTIRVSTLSIIVGAPVGNRLVPTERPSDYLFCVNCAETLDSYVRYIEANRGVPRTAAG